MDIIYAALVFSACQCLVFVCFAVFVHWYVSRQRDRIKAEIEDAVRKFITAPDDKTPSPVAVIIDQGALLLAARLMQQLKAMLAGAESGNSKAEGLERQLSMLDAAPPWAQAVLAILPKKIRTQLLNNPQMIGALSKFTSGNHAGDSEVTEIQRRMRNND